MMHKAVLLDTSFFIRFLNDSDPLFEKADNYYKYFLHNGITMMISTVSIAEYCTGGNFNELPFKNLQIVPFNIIHAKKAGEFAKTIFTNRGKLQIRERNIIPNDTKLFAQADTEESIEYYLTSDSRSKEIFNFLSTIDKPKFHFIDLNIPYNETFGLLDLK